RRVSAGLPIVPVIHSRSPLEWPGPLGRKAKLFAPRSEIEGCVSRDGFWILRRGWRDAKDRVERPEQSREIERLIRCPVHITGRTQDGEGTRIEVEFQRP